MVLTDEERKPYSCCLPDYLEVVEEVGEGCQLEQPLVGWCRVNDFMLQNPGEVVRDEDRVEASGECRVDVGAGAVADHPGAGGLAGVVLDDCEIGLRVLLRKDFYGAEVGEETGAVEFSGLFDGITLCDEDQAVTGG